MGVSQTVKDHVHTIMEAQHDGKILVTTLPSATIDGLLIRTERIGRQRVQGLLLKPGK
jgi:hypothetical protein